ncbi:helix-turn-helix transcriptional regulator [Caproicibacter sp.]|uniref:helix-turn-helix transcriptional regulator n=1 Tax=Caproicibacter sp. TaxID=2814884 RepID=UPI003988CE54
MKTDRLLEIIIYLLNHEKATAKQLADKFDVSVRTIQRDVDSISLTGVPILAATGLHGGYSIDSDYKIRNQFIGKEDFAWIVMALKSLSTSCENDRLNLILEKYRSLNHVDEPKIFLDYSVTRENQDVLLHNKIIEEAISRLLQIQFDYQNVKGSLSRKTVNPLILRFKWYAWYLFAFDVEKEEYRTYKIARMANLVMTNVPFQSPDNVEERLADSDKNYLWTCESIEVWCREDSIAELEEYFPGEKKERLNDGNYLLHLHVPPQEKLWQALLLSMGRKVRILSPKSYRDRLVRTAAEFLSNHDMLMS